MYTHLPNHDLTTLSVKKSPVRTRLHPTLEELRSWLPYHTFSGTVLCPDRLPSITSSVDAHAYIQRLTLPRNLPVRAWRELKVPCTFKTLSPNFTWTVTKDLSGNLLVNLDRVTSIQNISENLTVLFL